MTATSGKAGKMNAFQFFNEHWFLAWCALWLCWPVLGIVRLLVFNLPKHILRTIKVAIRGWPPEHLDADGDWKPEPKVQS